jgi:hypothetical protein
MISIGVLNCSATGRSAVETVGSFAARKVHAVTGCNKIYRARSAAPTDGITP